MKRLFILITLGLTLGNASAQPTIQLHRLEDALSIVEKQSLYIGISHLQLKAAQNDKKTAIGALLPSITAAANSDYNISLPVQVIPASFFGGPAGSTKEVKFGLNYNSALNFQAEVPLFHADKWAQLNANSASLAQAKADLDQQRRQWKIRVTQTYFSCLLTAEAIRLNESLDSSAIALYKATLLRYNQGLAGKVDLNRTENLMYSNRQQTKSLKLSYDLALQNLAVQLGYPATTPISIDDRLSTYSRVNAELSSSIDQLPAVRSAFAAETAALWRWKQQQRSVLPKISLNAKYGFNALGNEWLSSNDTRYQTSSVGISLSMPLFRGGQNDALNHKMKQQVAIARLQREIQQQNAENEQLEWQKRLKERVEASLVNKKRNDLSEESYLLSLQNYDQGIISLDQLFSILQEHVQARNSYLQSLADAAQFSNCLFLNQQ
jgi:outer membrane protein TolC